MSILQVPLDRTLEKCLTKLAQDEDRTPVRQAIYILRRALGLSMDSTTQATKLELGCAVQERLQQLAAQIRDTAIELTALSVAVEELAQVPQDQADLPGELPQG